MAIFQYQTLIVPQDIRQYFLLNSHLDTLWSNKYWDLSSINSYCRFVVSSDEGAEISQKNQIPPLVLFSLCKITAEALLFLKVLQAILVFSLFGALIISRNFFNFFLIFAEILFQEKSWYSSNVVQLFNKFRILMLVFY